MPTPPRPSRFPVKTALAVATVAAALMLWHWRIASTSSIYPPGLDWHSLPGVAKLQLFPKKKPKPKMPEPNVQGSGVPETQSVQPPDALLIDNAGTLDRFYASLAKLDRHALNASTTVVHFGDSPTTADLITGDVRQQLQQRFGDAGQGFNLIAKPWAWYGHREIDETDKGWKWNTGVGVMREGQYGIGGAEFDGGKDAFTRYKLSGSQQTSIEIIWKTAPDGGSFTVSADGNSIATIDTAHPVAESLAPVNPQTAPATVPTSVLSTPDSAAAVPTSATLAPPAHQFQTIILPSNTRIVELRGTQGTVRLYGVLFHRDQPGLVYDSIGLNGASITVLSRALAKDMMKASFVHLHPDLIVVNYGTNEAGFASFIDKQYEGELRTAIARVHEAAPNASILLMSPMDRGERGGGSGIATMATIPKIVAIQRRVAAETGCAFFNTFQAMGGDGTMQRWYEGKPRLVGGDLIHPTPQGAKIVATAFVDQIAEGYARYTLRTSKKTALSTASPQ